jgi:hypothetical protein
VSSAVPSARVNILLVVQVMTHSLEGEDGHDGSSGWPCSILKRLRNTRSVDIDPKGLLRNAICLRNIRSVNRGEGGALLTNVQSMGGLLLQDGARIKETFSCRY